MVALSHESYSCPPDKNGFSQRLSLNARPYEKVKTRKGGLVVYKALANSNGHFADPKHQEFMLAEFQYKSQTNEDSEVFCHDLVELNQYVQQIADKFNFTLVHATQVKEQSYKTRYAIQFQETQMAQLEEVSFMDKSRREGEYFVFSAKLSKSVLFLDSKATTGQRASGQRRGFRTKSSDSGRRDDWVLQAFVHFFFSLTGGRMIVDRLHGNHCEEEGYTLTRPVVHSVFGGCGPRDAGDAGIRRVIGGHRCNEYCSHLPDMRELLGSVMTFGEVSKRSLPVTSEESIGRREVEKLGSVMTFGEVSKSSLSVTSEESIGRGEGEMLGPVMTYGEVSKSSLPVTSEESMGRREVEMLGPVMTYGEASNKSLPVGCAGVWGRKARYPL